MKEFNKFFIASLKRTAQNVYPLVRRKNKIMEQIKDLQTEHDGLQAQIDRYQAPFVQDTGYPIEKLVERKVTDTGKKDKNGQPVKTTQYVLIYPETVIPPVEEEKPVVEPKPEEIFGEAPAPTDAFETDGLPDFLQESEKIDFINE